MNKGLLNKEALANFTAKLSEYTWRKTDANGLNEAYAKKDEKGLILDKDGQETPNIARLSDEMPDEKVEEFLKLDDSTGEPISWQVVEQGITRTITGTEKPAVVTAKKK
jgi:hypothetical protein